MWKVNIIVMSSIGDGTICRIYLKHNSNTAVIHRQLAPVGVGQPCTGVYRGDLKQPCNVLHVSWNSSAPFLLYGNGWYVKHSLKYRYDKGTKELPESTGLHKNFYFIQFVTKNSFIKQDCVQNNHYKYC